MYDFWHNRTLTTSAGQISVQSEFLATAETSLAYVKAQLSTAEFDDVLGADPYNEPYTGQYDSGQTSATCESGVLWPFYQKFRAEMDDAGWQGKSAYVEPNPFWNAGTSDKSPSVLKAMYQALDSGVSGANWWSQAASSGPVLSGTEWHWDIYNSQHDEPMNGNPSKAETGGDAWNGEDYSAVDMNSSGAVTLHYGAQLLDRLYPEAVAGSVLAFTYEDRSLDGSSVLTWNPVPPRCRSSRHSSAAAGTACWCGSPTGAPRRRSSTCRCPSPRPTRPSSPTSARSPVPRRTRPRATSRTPRSRWPRCPAEAARSGCCSPVPAQRATAQKELASWMAGQSF